MNSDHGQFIIVKQFTIGKVVSLQKASDNLNLQCLNTQNLNLLACHLDVEAKKTTSRVDWFFPLWEHKLDNKLHHCCRRVFKLLIEEKITSQFNLVIGISNSCICFKLIMFILWFSMAHRAVFMMCAFIAIDP